MSIMTSEQYEERKASLTSAIAHAEGEFQSASFKELTSSGSASASAKAKQHLDLLREELVKIEAAWVASREEIARLDAKSIADNFEVQVAGIDALLADRREALHDVMKAAEAATSALSRHREATVQIRSMAASMSRGTALSSDTVHSRVAAPMGIDVAGRAFSAILATAGVALTTGSFLRDAFPNSDPLAMEDDLARMVRAAVQGAAPRSEAA